MTEPRTELLAAALGLALAVPAAGADAGEGTATPLASAAVEAQAETDWDDYEIDPAQPDFTVVNLPTTLRLPKHRLAFRVTHRFGRPLGRGSFGDLLGDLFGLDGGAQIGIGLRFGVFSGSQLEAYRTSDRTIQLQLNQHVLSQGESAPLGLALLAGIEGRDNFSEDFSPSFGLVVSRKVADRAAFYLTPYWVGDAALRRDAGHRSSFILGLGTRLRLTDEVYLTGEWHPRVAGHEGPGEGNDDIIAFGVEMRVGGHAFQFNFSNDLSTTPGQIARGQVGAKDFFIGFNITRKFF